MSNKFRVEAFIIPSLNREIKPSENIIDDVKVAYMLREGTFINKLESIDEDSEYSDNSLLDESSESVESADNDISNLPTIKTDVVKSEGEKMNKILVANHYDGNKEISPVIKTYFKPKLNSQFCSDRHKNLNNVNINFSLSDSNVISTNDIIIDEPIYDIPYRAIKKSEALKFRKKLETDEFISSENRNKGLSALPKSLHVSSSSLVSIDESPEDCDNQLCCHGFRSGCTAWIQRPEQITEEIFEINWMKRLENLRAREAVIKEKETMLFAQERLLFKKERELRILERLIKDKLKHIELSSKRLRHQNIDSTDNCGLWMKDESTDGSKNSLEKHLSSSENLEKLEGKSTQFFKEVTMEKPIGKNFNTTDEKTNSALNLRLMKNDIKKMKSIDSISSESSTDSKMLSTNPSNSRNSLHISGEFSAAIDLARSTQYGRISSIRRKKKPKISYDDLDSTLSADIGDSSFVVTSKIFDPDSLKRPQAFTRSFSDRRPNVHVVEEGKVLKRIGNNILVSKDKETKFQNYGLIDFGKIAPITDNTEINENSHAYLDLERGFSSRTKERNGNVNAKERPISWNEEQNEWLQKKRMAYNSTIKRIPVQDFEKENLQKKPEVKKKLSVVKKFNIFR